MELWSDWPTSTSNSTRRSSSHWLLRPAPYFVLGSCHWPGCSVHVAVARCVLQHSLHWLKGITSDYLLRCAWTFQVVPGQWSKQLSLHQQTTDTWRHVHPDRCPPRKPQRAPESPREPQKASHLRRGPCPSYRNEPSPAWRQDRHVFGRKAASCT